MDSFRAQSMSSCPLLCVAWLQSGGQSHTILQHEDMPYSTVRTVLSTKGVLIPLMVCTRASACYLNIFCVDIPSTWCCFLLPFLKCIPAQTLLGGVLTQLFIHPLLECRRILFGETNCTPRTFHHIVILLMSLINRCD